VVIGASRQTKSVSGRVATENDGYLFALLDAPTAPPPYAARLGSNAGSQRSIAVCRPSVPGGDASLRSLNRAELRLGTPASLRHTRRLITPKLAVNAGERRRTVAGSSLAEIETSYGLASHRVSVTREG